MEVWATSEKLEWESVREATSLGRNRKSEMSLNERARALEWAGTTSVFSPGVLQEWMVFGDSGRGTDWEARGFADDRFEKDPWALRPMEEIC